MDTVAVSDQTTSEIQPVFKKRGGKSSNIRKRPATPPPDDSDSSSGYTSTEDEGRRVKRRRKTAIVTASSANAPRSQDVSSTTLYAGDRSTAITDTNDATKHSNWYEEVEKKTPDSKSLLGSTRPLQSTSTSTNNPSSSSKPKAMGPVKAPTNVRTITVTDYAPDVCKDYKTTGFCGFGDSCKFLHAREAYAQGWQLDKEWEKAGKGGPGTKKPSSSTNPKSDPKNPSQANDADDDEAALLEKIPFACIICKQPYKNPIITKCNHYFCESCALQRYKKTPACAACGAGTNGVFNGAKGLKKLLERKKEREERKREEEEREKLEAEVEEG